jgi:hypothetical protein
VVSWFRDHVLGTFVAGLFLAGAGWLLALMVPAIREKTADLFNSQVRMWQVTVVVVATLLLLALGIRAVAARGRRKLSTPSLPVWRVEHAGALWTVKRAWYVGSHRAAVFGPFCPNDGAFLSLEIDGHLVHGHPEKPQPWEQMVEDSTFKCMKCGKTVHFELDMGDLYSIVRNIGVAVPVEKK